jgi:CheY-like chemotaxis protein
MLYAPTQPRGALTFLRGGHTTLKPEAERGAILVVDDNVDILRQVKAILELTGYDVITASDGEEALRFYEAHRPMIRLLLTDLAMPKMNGLDLAKRILRTDSDLPVVFMSGSGRSPGRDLEYIAKPFRSAELVEKIGRALDPKKDHQGAAFSRTTG